MERWVGRVALVTGASAGFGAAIAKRLVEHGMKVVGCARNITKIQESAEALKDQKGSLTPLCCDVSKEEEVLAMFDKIKKDLGGVDVCINNAGLAHDAPLLSGSTEDWRHMLEVNVLGLCVCSREAFKSMKDRGVDDGHIFLLGSMSGHRVINSPSSHMYAATKFAVRAITDGLRYELNNMKSHIRVTTACLVVNPIMVGHFVFLFNCTREGRTSDSMKVLGDDALAISPGLAETEFSYRMLQDEKAAKERYSRFENLQSDDIVDSLIYALSAPPRCQVHDILIRPTEQPF